MSENSNIFSIGVGIWDIATGSQIRSIWFGGTAAKPVFINRHVFSPDGWSVIITDSKKITLWDLELDKQRVIATEEYISDTPPSFSPDGKTVVYRTAASNILRDIQTGMEIAKIPSNASMQFMPGGYLLAGFASSTLHLRIADIVMPKTAPKR